MATDGTPATGGQLPRGVIEDLLAAERRRLALRCLAANGGRMVVDDLAAQIRAEELGVDPAAIGDEQRRAVREAFFQRHLPKLTATGVVDYDSMRGRLTLCRPELADRARDRSESPTEAGR